MTQKPASGNNSPLLDRFRELEPGELYQTAAKIHLEEAFDACKANTLVDAAWNGDKSSLTVKFRGGFLTTLMRDGYRIIPVCSCRQWQPARNCPHVVIAWVTLKRAVSNQVLAMVQVNQQMIADMQRFIKEEPRSIAVDAPPAGNVAAMKSRSVVTPPSEPAASAKPASRLRFVIMKDRFYNSVFGRFMRGNEPVAGWSSIGLPPEISRFMLSHYQYEPNRRYFESLYKLCGKSFPIAYRHNDGTESPLLFRPDKPVRAGMSFDLKGEEVIISRTLQGGIPLSDSSMVHGELLLDLDAGEICPVENLSIWKRWETVLDDLEALYDLLTFEDENDYLEFEESDENSGNDFVEKELRLLPHAVAAPVTLFNEAGIRLDSSLFQNDSADYCFLVDGVLTMGPERTLLSYGVNIPHGMSAESVSMQPVALICEGESADCSAEVFWPLNPGLRTKMPVKLRSKKRLRAILETAFALMDEPSSGKHAGIIRQLTGSSDFANREIKNDAKKLLEKLADQWKRQFFLLQARADGWLCAADYYRQQAQLMRILVETFGIDAFRDGLTPGAMEVPKELLTKALPELIGSLESRGFSLNLGSAPLVSAAWEFSIDATRSSLDWFELKPEIRCDGELLSEEELAGLFDGSGMIQRNGRLIMLDDLAAQVLSMFSGAAPAGKGKKRKKEKNGGLQVPRLQILDWLQLRQRGVTVRLSEEDSRILDSLLNFEQIPDRELPPNLDATLRHYQTDAWRWLAFLYEHRFGACLADDMGLGKTLQGISLLAGIMSGKLRSAAPTGTPHLVVAPPTLMFNWEAEIARFLPGAKTAVYSGSGRSVESLAGIDIVITSYGIVHRDIARLEEVRFNVVIFDETQVVKNLQAVTSNAVRRLKSNFVLALTGTPLENHLGEYYAIMDLCLPGLLGTREQFSRISALGNSGTARLISRTRPFVLRRTKEMIADELPPKIETDIRLELTPKQKSFYQRTVEEVRGQVREAYESHASAQARIIALTAILRLRQICLTPALAAGGADTVSPKLEFLLEQLEELRDEGHSALVFSQFTSYLDIIESGFKARGVNFQRLDGSTPVPQRKKLVQAFQDSAEPMVFLISLKAGGKGLNLTRATYVYHMDPWWNPAVENQASDRAHRIGQTEQVTITRIIMRHTIEEKMMILKEQKTELYRAILENGTGSGGSALTREDMEFLLG